MLVFVTLDLLIITFLPMVLILTVEPSMVLADFIAVTSSDMYVPATTWYVNTLVSCALFFSSASSVALGILAKAAACW